MFLKKENLNEITRTIYYMLQENGKLELTLSISNTNENTNTFNFNGTYTIITKETKNYITIKVHEGDIFVSSVKLSTHLDMDFIYKNIVSFLTFFI